MYPPRFYQETDKEVLLEFMRSAGFGTLITCAGDGPQATNLPVLIRQEKDRVVLTAHLHKGNPQVRPETDQALFLFQGPNAYIRPGWYETKKRDGRAVPTWNYATVKARGRMRIIEDRAWLLQHVTEMSLLHEAEREDPWSPDDAPAAYIEQLLKGILGVEVQVDSLSGVFKMSQNHPEENRRGAIAGLLGSGSRGAAEVGDFMLEAERRRFPLAE